MFTARFKIYIMSADNTLEKRLKEFPLPEDHTVEIIHADSTEIIDKEDDCAVVIDCREWIIAEMPKTKAHFTVLLVSADNMPEANVLWQADDLWIMPKKSGDDILWIHFNRLIKTMTGIAENRRLKICFETAIDSIPDLVWFKNSIGEHLIVNDSFCKAVEKTKEQIFKKGHYYIWDISESEYAQGDFVCLESEQTVIEARKTCTFDEKVQTKRGMRLFHTYKSPLIDKSGEIFGTCGIAHDVTDIQNTNNELDVVLDSIPYAVIVDDISGKVLSTNSKFSEYFPKTGELVGKDFNRWKRSVLRRKTINADGNTEIVRGEGAEQKTLVFMEEPIYDIFHDKIGNIYIFRDITLERKLEQQTLRSANTDFMTGLHNRRSLFTYLAEIGVGTQISLLMIDLDNFKKVNDTFGHQRGDEALLETSRLLNKCFPADFIARLGGDEFLVVIKGEHTREELIDEGERTLNTLCAYYRTRKEFMNMSASIGIATTRITEDGESVDNLILNSDSAMYNAKNSGKAAVRFYEG